MNKIYFLPPEETLETIKLGFDEDCLGYYNKISYNGKWEFDTRIWDNCVDYIIAPTYQQVFKYFRDKFNIECTPITVIQGKNKWYDISLVFNEKIEDYYTRYDSFEEAELECVRKILKKI